MTAESLPFSTCTPVPGALSGWELEAWYEDLQDILLSDVNNGVGQEPLVLDQKECKHFDSLDCSSCWTTDSLGDSFLVDVTVKTSQSVSEEHFPTNELEFLSGESPVECQQSFVTSLDNADTSPLVPEADSGSSCPSQTLTEDEESSRVSCGTKRKRNGQPQGGKLRVKEKEQENERKVLELMAENERLKNEIERLSAEVDSTRKALIDRMVNLKHEVV
ncbi:DNA damage-inducible transcript 3 protein [Microcaecilia unicolor]|uniref:DNA damage-inducible transcript 3 protein n=1 Tax=Microcaecilia unicolor TaxID=1415580 RepID=A0A6P7XH12_9AMPH|nr:DNA damage-inducible transcript 3 protein [Microcaecilia unicolor]